MRKILVVIVCLVLIFGSALPAAADLLVQEADLNPDGTAYEVNPDQQGGLWISDYWAGEVWYVNLLTTPATYTAYSTDTNSADYNFPADARRSGDFFWWVDSYSNFIGQAAVNTGDYNLYQIPNPHPDPLDPLFFFAMSFDSQGRLWASDGSKAFIYSLAVSYSNGQAEVCSYPLAENAEVSYLVYEYPYLWLGDALNSRLLRIDVEGNYGYSSWQLPDNDSPNGMAIDGESDIWYADTTNNSLRELDPATGFLTGYDVPSGVRPQMLTVVGNEVWFTGWLPGTVGKLDSTSVGDLIAEINPDAGTLTPTCATQTSPYETGNLSMTTGLLNWSTDFYPPMTEDAGWQNYQMPANSAPWGIAFQNQKVWVVDSVRNKLVQVVSLNDVTPNKVFLPLIKR